MIRITNQWAIFLSWHWSLDESVKSTLNKCSASRKIHSFGFRGSGRKFNLTRKERNCHKFGFYLEHWLHCLAFIALDFENSMNQFNVRDVNFPNRSPFCTQLPFEAIGWKILLMDYFNHRHYGTKFWMSKEKCIILFYIGFSTRYNIIHSIVNSLKYIGGGPSFIPEALGSS